MKNAKTLIYWIAAGLVYRQYPTNSDADTTARHTSKAYKDIQTNFGTISGTWEWCGYEYNSAPCECQGLVRYGHDPYWSD